MASYDAPRLPTFAVTTDAVILTIRDGALCVPLVQRSGHPYRGRWALPGGFVATDEDLADAAARALEEKTGLVSGSAHLEQLGTYGTADRDPRMRVVSVAYLALLPQQAAPEVNPDATKARWWKLEDVTDDMLAFDHAHILADGVERARAKLEYTAIATSFLAAVFTLRELQTVYEIVWGCTLHRPNFRRKVLATDGFVTETPQSRDGTIGRPAKLYRAGRATTLHPAILRG